MSRGGGGLGGRAERLVELVVLGVFALIALGPIVTIVAQALGPPRGDDSSGGLANFARSWTDGRFGRLTANSFVVAAVVVVCSTPLSVMAGHALANMRFRGAGWWHALFLLGIMTPAEAVIVPAYFDLRALGLVDTLWAVAGPQIAQSVAFGVFWMRAAFRALDPAVRDAAVVDGARPAQVLWRVQAPMARPAIATLVVLVFMWTWNEFLIPLVMSPTGRWRTAPLGLAYFEGRHVTDHALLAAAAVIVAVPVVAIYAAMRRQVMAGMTEGAVTG